MLVVYSFHAGDLPLALANLSLCQALGGCTEFDCVLVTDDQTPHAEMQRIASQTFRRVETHVISNVPQGWPRGANTMFERAAKYVWEKHPLSPFLFMEADSTPIRPGWLKDIAAAYVANGLPFMGPIRSTFGTHNGFPESQGGIRMVVGRHMNGMAVYPAGYFGQSDILRIMPNAFAPFDVQLSDEQASRPFLINGAMKTGRMDSPFFAHSWKTRNFRMGGERFMCDQDDPRAEMDEINPRVTALFHGVKDTSLAELIADKYRDTTKFPHNMGETIAPLTQRVDRHMQAMSNSAIANDPQYAEFLAWKQSQMLQAQIALSSGPTLQERLLQQSSEFAPSTQLPPPVPNSSIYQAQRDAITQGMPVVRPEPYAPVSVESFSAIPRNPAIQAPIPENAIAVEGDAHLEPMADPAQRLATLANLPKVDVLASENNPVEAVLTPDVQPHDKTLFQSPPASKAPIYSGPAYLPTVEESQFPAELASESSSPEISVISADDKSVAIKADIRSGMAHKTLLATHGINAVMAKQYKDEVKAEDAQQAAA